MSILGSSGGGGGDYGSSGGGGGGDYGSSGGGGGYGNYLSYFSFTSPRSYFLS